MRSGGGERRGESVSRSDRKQSYSQEDRVSKAQEYRRVYRTGRKLHSPSATVFLLENGRARPRLGVTVTRRVANAVGRNRVKRRVREIFRRNRSAIPMSWDIVVNVRPGAGGRAYGDLERDFLGVMKRGGKAGK